MDERITDKPDLAVGVIVRGKALADLLHLQRAEQERRNVSCVPAADIVADCLHAARYALALDAAGRWQAVEHKHAK